MSDLPNILWIQTDEQRPDSLSCYGSEWAKTPTLQRLADRGTVMRNAVCQSPVCVPSRSSQLSGRYPHEIGSLINKAAQQPFPPDTVTFPELFRKAGYETVSFGKRHIPAHEIWEGGDQTVLFTQYSHYFDLNEKYDEDAHHVVKRTGGTPIILAGTYPDVDTNPSKHISDQAISFLRQRNEESRPFLLRVSHNWPHTPVLPPAPFDSLYDPAEIPIRYFDKGAYECRSAFDRPVADRDKLWELSKDQIRQVWKDYMGLCAYVDHEAGRVIDVLDELGLRENTIVVYSADHGKMLGEWGAGEKDVFDNEVWRVPFIWSWPGHIPEGKSRAEPCELIDTPRTLLSLAGLGDKIPPEYRGRDLFSDPAPDAVFGSIRSSLDPPESNAMRFAVRTDRYRMDVSWPIGGPRPRLSDCDGNLFDLTEDPFETRNVFGESEYKSAQMDLMDRIDSWLSGTEWDPRLLDPETAKTLY